MRRATETVKLAYALDRDGVRTWVGDLDARRRAARAPFACPGCRDALVPHLGLRRARHFAHKPGSSCPLTAPETALHFNAKERLLDLCLQAFAGKREVVIETRCPACRRLAPRLLADLGDAALTEGAVGSLRADVLVARRGAPSFAFEVLVTHAVPVEKEDALAALGVPAVEIDARAGWEQVEEGRTRVACARGFGLPPCPACEAGARADADRDKGGEAAAIAELEQYRARGLMGSRPGPAVATPTALSARERAALARAFCCAHCGSPALEMGERLVRHACPGRSSRAVAWRGYDGALVELGWWKRA